MVTSAPPAVSADGPAATTTRGSWPRRGGFALAALAALAAFVPGLDGGFLGWDDAGYVLDNQAIHTLSLGTVHWAFTEFCCNYWAPLTWLSLALDHAAWGLEPFGYHLTNALLHALNAALLFEVGLRLLGRAAGAGPRGPPAPPWVLPGALLAALWWGLHPLRVESVAWVSERKDVLSAFFGLLAILAWLRHAGDAAPGGPTWGFLRRRSYLVALAFYALSLLAKPGLVSLPVALLVLDWFPLRRLAPARGLALAAEKLPLLLLAAGAALVTMAATAPTLRPLSQIGLGTRILVAFTSLTTYLRLAIAPLDISPVYYHPERVDLSGEVILSIAAVLGLCAGAAWQSRRRPALLAAWLFFLVTIFPVLGLVLNGPQALAPRFTYVPGMALALLLGGGAAAWLTGLASLPRRAALAALALALAGLVALTARDVGHWRDDLSLWTRVVELDPTFPASHNELAIALTEVGRYEEAVAVLDRAVALSGQRGHGLLHRLLALRAGLLWELGRNSEAAADLKRAAASVGEPLRSAYLRQLPLLDEPAAAPAP